jgi:hypothetical protein
MIMKQLTVYCDDCAHYEPLLSSTNKDADVELTNKGWTKDKTKHTYCPRCSLKRVQEQANA